MANDISTALTTLGYLSALSDLNSWIVRNARELDVRTLRALNAELARLNSERQAKQKDAA